jgi:hypothetical protein
MPKKSVSRADSNYRVRAEPVGSRVTSIRNRNLASRAQTYDFPDLFY